MVAWAARLERLRPTVRFDYLYQQQGRRSPDRLPKLLAAHRAALDAARIPGQPVVLAGKSMGSRVGCHLANEVAVDALICFGYPLLGQGDPTKRRDEVLLALRTPVLFVQGTRDPLCPLADLAAVRAEMKAPTRLVVVDTGDHSLLVTKTAARVRSQAQVDEDVLGAIASFLADVALGKLAEPSTRTP